MPRNAFQIEFAGENSGEALKKKGEKLMKKKEI